MNYLNAWISTIKKPHRPSLSMGLSMVFSLPEQKSITPNDSLHRQWPLSPPPVPADLQSAGAELGDLQSPMLTLALMLFHVSVAKIMVLILLNKPFSRIANADIQGWRIANPPELERAVRNTMLSFRVRDSGSVPAMRRLGEGVSFRVRVRLSK